jgi:hypothetical protein
VYSWVFLKEVRQKSIFLLCLFLSFSLFLNMGGGPFPSSAM